MTGGSARAGSIRSEDAGIGMILVIGIVIFVMALSATAIGIALHALAQSRNRVSYEQALAVAETGVDFTLGNIQRAYDLYNADFAVPSPATTAQPTPVCNLPAVSDDLSRPASAAEERAWAASKIATIVSNDPSCIQRAPNGDYVIFKPASPLVNNTPKAGRVYVQSWVPGFGVDGAKTRLVKSEYLFMPYRPTHAVLTGGNLTIEASTTITAAYGVSADLAAVHANGAITVEGNPTVTGPVSSTADSPGAASNNFTANAGGSVVTQPRQGLPRVSALSLYYQAASHPESLTTWFDLCPDAAVRSYSTAGPCTGTLLNPAPGGGYVSPFRGWELDADSHTWTATRDALPGTYFAYQANITSGNGNATFPNFTVIAAAANPDDCATKRYGTITWDHYAIDAPAYPNLWMYADSDVVTTPNFTAGHGISAPPVVSGMFVAGDQIHMETSSQGAVGAVSASDQCESPLLGSHGLPLEPGEGLITTNEIKNPEIYYDPNSDSPFSGIVDTTLWLEYPG